MFDAGVQFFWPAVRIAMHELYCLAATMGLREVFLWCRASLACVFAGRPGSLPPGNPGSAG